MKKSFIFVAIIAVLAVWIGVLYIQMNDNDENTSTVVETYAVDGFSTDLSVIQKQVVSSVVTVNSLERLSSGFIYKTDDNGFYVITCAHSINKEEDINVVLDNEQIYEAELIGTDIYSDIAVLKVNSDIIVEPVSIANSEILNEGEFVLCIGTPSSIEFRNSTNFAIVSSKLRTISNSITVDKETYTYYTSLIQLSTSIDSGYSGSPVFNMNGEAVGVITMKASSEVLAVPINEVRMIADGLINDGEVIKLQLGVKGSYLKSLENYQKSNLGISLDIVDGLYVSQVQANSIASTLGIVKGDIITDINSQHITNNDDYLKAVYQKEENLSISIYREGETITLSGTTND